MTELLVIIALYTCLALRLLIYYRLAYLLRLRLLVFVLVVTTLVTFLGATTPIRLALAILASYKLYYDSLIYSFESLG